MKKKRKKRRKNRNKNLLVMLISAVIGIGFSVGVILLLSSGRAPSPELIDTDLMVGATEGTTEEPATEPDPVPYIVSTAKIG